MWLIGLAIVVCAVLAVPAGAVILDTSKDNFLAGEYYNNLISDDEFLDIDALSVAEIQDFFVQKGSFLQSYFEGGRSAARIVWDAAHALTPDAQGSLNGITIDQTTGTVSSRILLCMLQVQQGLVTCQVYNQYKLDYAMGFGCLEGGNWNPIDKGFAKQVEWSAWQQRYNFHRAEVERTDLPNYKVGQTMTFSNIGYPNMDVTFANRATASLYHYTPHVFNANYNTWSLYNTWEAETAVPEPSSLVGLMGCCSILGGITRLKVYKRKRK
jgi:hypothetical protein